MSDKIQVKTSKLMTTGRTISEDAIRVNLHPYTSNFSENITFGVEIEFLGPREFEYPRNRIVEIEEEESGFTWIFSDDDNVDMRVHEHSSCLGNADLLYRMRFAKRLTQKAMLGVKPANYSDHQYADGNYGVWKLKEDSSVRTHARNHVGRLELVSPILHGQDGLEVIKRMCKALRKLKCKQNNRCGTHVHFGVRSFFRNVNLKVNPGRENEILLRSGHNGWDVLNHDQRSIAIKRVFDVYAEYEAQLDTLVSKDRRRSINTYCRSTRRVTSNWINTPEGSKRDVRAIEVERMDDRMLENERYCKLNLTGVRNHGRGTIEVRQLHGTFQHAEIHRWVWLHQKLIHRALMGGIMLRHRAPKDEGGMGRTFAHLLGYLRADRRKGRSGQTEQFIKDLRKRHRLTVEQYGGKISDRVSSVLTYANGPRQRANRSSDHSESIVSAAVPQQSLTERRMDGFDENEAEGQWSRRAVQLRERRQTIERSVLELAAAAEQCAACTLRGARNRNSILYCMNCATMRSLIEIDRYVPSSNMTVTTRNLCHSCRFADYQMDEPHAGPTVPLACCSNCIHYSQRRTTVESEREEEVPERCRSCRDRDQHAPVSGIAYCDACPDNPNLHCSPNELESSNAPSSSIPVPGPDEFDLRSFLRPDLVRDVCVTMHEHCRLCDLRGAYDIDGNSYCASCNRFFAACSRIEMDANGHCRSCPNRGMPLIDSGYLYCDFCTHYPLNNIGRRFEIRAEETRDQNVERLISLFTRNNAICINCPDRGTTFVCAECQLIFPHARRLFEMALEHDRRRAGSTSCGNE